MIWECRRRAGRTVRRLVYGAGGRNGDAAYRADGRRPAGKRAGAPNRKLPWLSTGTQGGFDLARRAVSQPRRFGVEILAAKNGTGGRVEWPVRLSRGQRHGNRLSRVWLIDQRGLLPKGDVPVRGGVEWGGSVTIYAPMTEALSY